MGNRRASRRLEGWRRLIRRRVKSGDWQSLQRRKPARDPLFIEELIREVDELRLDRPRVSLAAGLAAVELAEILGHVDLTCLALSAAASTHLEMGQYRKAKACFERAALLDVSDSKIKAELLRRLALFMGKAEERYSDAALLLKSASKLVPEPEFLVKVASVKSYLASERGEYSKVLEIWSVAIHAKWLPCKPRGTRYSKQEATVLQHVVCNVSAALALIENLPPEALREALDAMLALHKTLGSRGVQRLTAKSNWTIGLLYIRLEEYRKATPFLTSARRTLRESDGDPAELVEISIDLWFAYLSGRRFKQAREVRDELEEMARVELPPASLRYLRSAWSRGPDVAAYRELRRYVAEALRAP